MLTSKLPNVGTTIFTVMSRLAKENNAINLSQGFPNFDLDPKLKELSQSYIEKGFNQYAPMAGDAELRKVLCAKMNKAYGSNLDSASEITITAGATQAIFTAISTFIRNQDEVIIIEPAYDCYTPAIEVNGGIVRSYKMLAPNFQVDWNELQKLITPSTKMIIVNNPNNPAGSVFSQHDLVALEKIVIDHDLILLSDEVYEHLVYDGAAHHSVLKFEQLRKRSLATFSFGKTFHATGWKIGYVVGPENLMSEFRKVHQFNVFCVNHPLQKALAEYLKDPAHYLALSSFYQQKRDFLKTQLLETGLSPLPCKGTYFQLYDYSKISDLKDTHFSTWLTEEHKVATIPLSPFYTNGTEQKIVRICFAKKEETLAHAGHFLKKLRRGKENIYKPHIKNM